MSHEKLIDRIRKLLALSKSNNSPEEAASAASAASELMRENEIEEAELRVTDETVKAEPIERATVDAGGRVRQAWKGTVAYSLAKSLGCHMWWEGPAIRVLGRQSAARSMFYLFAYLVNEVNALAESGYKASGLKLPAAAVVAWKNAFRHGAANIIAQRLRVERETIMAQAPASAPSSAALAIIVKDQGAVDLAFKDMSKGFRTVGGGRISNRDGFNAGRAAGANVSLGGGRGLGAAPGKLTSK